MGKLSRTKGAAFELLVANQLREVWPGAKRGLGQARDAKGLADVEGTPFHVQCKHGAQPNIVAAMAQADKDRNVASDGRPPLVVTRRDRGEVLVTMRLSDWIAVAANAEVLRKVVPAKTPCVLCLGSKKTSEGAPCPRCLPTPTAA